MDEREAVIRAIGILTEARQIGRAAQGDAAAGPPDEPPPEEPRLGGLLTEAFPTVELPPDCTAEEARQATLETVMPGVLRLVGAFAYVFSELAVVHDAGRGDITTEDLLRTLALRYAESG